jgi:purine-binding chemotaxis protein CheW
MEQPKNQTKHLKFHMNDQCILLPLHQVQLVLRLPALQDVPSDAKGFEGILNYHGVSVPVYSLGAWLGVDSPEYTLDTPLVLCGFEGELMGLLVSDVTDVIDVPYDDIKVPKLSDLPGFVRVTVKCGVWH